MTSEQLRNTMHATPFRPFVVHLGDGQEVPVSHPDFIAHAPDSRTVIVTFDEETSVAIDVPLVTYLKYPRWKSAAGYSLVVRQTPDPQWGLLVAFDQGCRSLFSFIDPNYRVLVGFLVRDRNFKGIVSARDRRRAIALLSALCLFGLATLWYTGYWWPGVLFVLGPSLIVVGLAWCRSVYVFFGGVCAIAIGFLLAAHLKDPNPWFIVFMYVYLTWRVPSWQTARSKPKPRVDQSLD